MGWLFGWDTRKALVDRLCDGNGVKTLKRCFKGNNMWTVQQLPNGHVFACLYLIKGPAYGNKNDRHGWGYKDVDETMGPYSWDFPASWLDLLSPCTSEYSIEWRKRVRERAALLARFKVGTTWERADGSIYTIVQRRSPTSLRVKDQYGDYWRTKPSTLLGAKEITNELQTNH